MEVDMTEHEKTSYYFVLSDPNEAVCILSEKGFVVKETNNGILAEIPNRKLNSLINELKQHFIEIKDIHKEVSGSEKLYEELFEV